MRVDATEIIDLMKEHSLSFVQNPGGGVFM